MAVNATTVAKLQVELAYKTKGDLNKEAQKAKKALKSLGDSAKDGEKSTSKFLASIKRIAGYRLLRTALKVIAQGFKEGATNALLWEKVTGNSRYLATMSKLTGKLLELKNALGSMVMPVLEALAPLLISISNILIRVAEIITKVVGAISGAGYYLKAKTQENYDYAKSLKTVNRQLLAFDELNIMSANNTSDQNGGVEVGDYFEKVDFKGKTKSLSDFFSEVHKIIEENINKIENAFIIAPLALGAFMILTDNWVEGIKLIALGGAMFAGKAVLTDTDLIPNTISTILENVSKLFTVVGLGMAAVGLLICCMGEYGNLGLGLGLLISGIGTTAGAMQLGDVTEDVKKRLTGLMEMIGWGSLAIGALMFFFAQSPAAKAKGLGLMFAGCGALGSAIAINWDGIVQKFEEVINKIKTKIQEVIDWYKNTELYSWLHGEKFSAMKNYMNENGLGGYFDNPLAYGSLYAGGGTPPMGTMFVAGETGDPEFVGNINGRTSVYNSDQLAGSLATANQGVENAIYQVANLIIAAINSQPVPSIKIGDREIYQASQRGKTIAGRSLIQGV